MVRGIAANVDGDTAEGDLDRQAAALLEPRVAAGYAGAEIPLPPLDVVRDGVLAHEALARVRAVLARYPLRYTVHGPNDLNLARNTPRSGRLLAACLEASAELGAEVYVYHSGQIALHDAAAGFCPPPTEARLRDMWSVETEAMTAAAETARRLGIVLVVENRDPHRWEVAALERWGRDGRSLVRFHQGMRLDLLAAQVAAIDSPSLGVCLDVGHAFLAAPYWHDGSYLDGIRGVAPWVRHLHLHDNFGRLDDVGESLADRLLSGEADNHLPPGWGAIPLRDVMAALLSAGYAGWVVVEMRPRYEAYLAQALETTRALLA